MSKQSENETVNESKTNKGAKPMPDSEAEGVAGGRGRPGGFHSPIPGSRRPPPSPRGR